MTDSTPSTEGLPRPDGLPRRRKAAGRLAAPVGPEAGSTELGAAGLEGGAGTAAEPGSPDLAEPISPSEPAAESQLDSGSELDSQSELSSLEIARRIVDAAEDKKAAEIVLLDVTELTTMADYFVICSGGSERQLGAIADGVTEKLREEGVRPIGREGGANAHWTLLDYGSVIVHVFAPPERDYYQLERHWAKAKTILRVQ